LVKSYRKNIEKILIMLTKTIYNKKIKELVANFPDSKNWHTAENRWLYHDQAIKWVKELKPNTILEIGGLGIKIKEDSKSLDNGSWKVKYKIDYEQDVRNLNIPYFDCIIALRVLHHYPNEFKSIFSYLRSKCKYLIISLPSGFSVEKPDEITNCNDSNIYLWK
jgi:hypothetical protein